MNAVGRLTLRIRGAPILLLACGPAYGQGPVSFTLQVPDAVVGDCDTLVAWVWNGPLAPTDPRHLTASCADARVCEVRYDARNVWVHGLAPGSTVVKLAFDHPATGAHEEHAVPVVFRPVPPSDLLHPRIVSDTCAAFRAAAADASAAGP
jgi:hypothetical protein